MPNKATQPSLSHGKNIDLPFKKMWNERFNDLYYGVELEVEYKEHVHHDHKYMTHYKLSRMYNDYKNSELSGMKKMVEVANLIDKITLEEFDTKAVLKSDYTIHCGYEIVTCPATLRYHKEKLWTKFFSDTGSAKLFKGEDWVGIHIHFSREALKEAQLAKVILFMHEASNRKFIARIAERDSFNQRGYFKPKDAIAVEDTLSVAGQGRAAIHISSRFRGATCEVRIWRSNPTEQGVFQALEFLDALISYCGQCGDKDSDILSTAFIDWFYKTERSIKYPFFAKNLIKLGFKEPARADLLLNVI